MGKVLLIGAGGVGTVVAHKMAGLPDVFSEIMLASRTKSKCDAIAAQIGGNRIQTAQVDADNVPELVELINSFKPDLVVNVALPYQDLTIMDACLKPGFRTSTQQTTSLKMRPSSNTNGSGPTRIVSNKQA
jgi:carboxynorspermidine dehydrogenase